MGGRSDMSAQRSLSRQPELNHEVLYDSLRQLLDGLSTSLDRDSFMSECLDMLVELFGADRGLVLLTDSDGATHVINARSGGKSLLPIEREEVTKTVIREAQRSGRCVHWEADASSDFAESMVSLKIIAALAVPLRAISWRVDGGYGEELETRGVLYLDFREFDIYIGESHRELFEAAGVLLAVVLEQGHQLRLASEYLRAARVEQSASRAPTLRELLSPLTMEPLRREVVGCLQSPASILILGESGTGKTLLAQAIAEALGRKPIVRATLGASDDLNTITSELFGHERGAFSGAITHRKGLVEYADSGTLILDEILNLPLNAQQLLLDFTQFGTYRPLGYSSPEPKHAEVRLITATNGDLDTAIGEGRFRQDLYYRLARVVLTVPPLRERREDIPSLAEAILARIDPVKSWRLTVPLRRVLMSEQLDWPGNIRQLESVVLRALDRALAADPDADHLTPEHLSSTDLGHPSLSLGAEPNVARGDEQLDEESLHESWCGLLAERDRLEERERELISSALDRFNGVVAHAALELGLSRTGLLSRIKTLKIERPPKIQPRRPG